MEREEIKAWLDKLVDNNQQRKELVTFNNQIRVFHPDTCIFVSSGIELIAKIMGIELVETYDENREYCYQYGFSYRGTMFRQMEQERLVTGNVQV